MAMQLKARLASTPDPGTILRNFMKYRALAFLDHFSNLKRLPTRYNAGSLYCQLD